MIEDSEESRLAVELLKAEIPDSPRLDLIAEGSFEADDEDGEHRQDRKVYRVINMSDDDLEVMINDIYPAEHCQHSYDCCAHWYQGRAEIERHGDIAIITLNYTQNI